jgi:hypothetical protein
MQMYVTSSEPLSFRTLPVVLYACHTAHQSYHTQRIMGRKYWLPGRCAFTPLCSAVRKMDDTEPVYNSYKRPLYKVIIRLLTVLSIMWQ